MNSAYLTRNSSSCSRRRLVSCAICGNGNDGPRQLSIDHDHVTGQVRGLLCDRCNPMLGYARDSIAVLEAAIEYLKKN